MHTEVKLFKNIWFIQNVISMQGMYKNRVKNDTKFLLFYLANEEIESGKIQNKTYTYFEF